MKKFGRVCAAETLDRSLADSRGDAGDQDGVPGIKNAAERADLIADLATLK